MIAILESRLQLLQASKPAEVIPISNTVRILNIDF